MTNEGPTLPSLPLTPANVVAGTGSLLVAGTSSDAGKSLLVTALCRWLARNGVSVAPFKAQNMSNNSMVCAGGVEIGRAQWLQALAAGVTPHQDMNPVLLKPGSDRTSHIVLGGRPYGTLHAGQWAHQRAELAAEAYAAYERLRGKYEVVIAEGAGSPAEINLRRGDYTNMGLACRFKMPVLVVGDIDRGGVLAAMLGTLAALEPQDQALIVGWVVNRFRGQLSILTPGLETLAERTGRPVIGVVPWLAGVGVDAEDSLSALAANSTAGDGFADGADLGGTLRVVVVPFPRVSNTTDVEAIAAEPGVDLQVSASRAAAQAADLLVLPGTRSTVNDLEWLRRTGLAEVVKWRAANKRPILGICGGYQMLSVSIHDPVESGRGAVPGLGLLPTTVTMQPEKVLTLPETTWRGHPVKGYAVHHGITNLATKPGQTHPESLLTFLDGWQSSTVWGTTWHGAWENDSFRRAWLTQVADQAGNPWTPITSSPGFAERREAMVDKLADAVEENLDTAWLHNILGTTSRT